MVSVGGSPCYVFLILEVVCCSGFLMRMHISHYNWHDLYKVRQDLLMCLDHSNETAAKEEIILYSLVAVVESMVVVQLGGDVDVVEDMEKRYLQKSLMLIWTSTIQRQCKQSEPIILLSTKPTFFFRSNTVWELMHAQ